MDASARLVRHYQHPLVRLGNLALGAQQRLTGRAERLDVEAMHELASRRTGLADFGPPDYLEGMHCLVGAINDEAGLHRFGAWMARVHLTDTLINRLLVARYRRDVPASRGAVIRRPLFILGLPRTGSTMLHHLLAADPAHRWPSHLEVAMPAPAPRGAGRLVPAEASWRHLHRFAPDLMRKHPTAPDAPDECFPLFANAFANPMAEYQWHVPGYGDWLFDGGLGPAAYAYFADQVRVLQTRRPGERWLFKSPMHLAYLDALFAAFPDACIVQLHRDPREVMGSACSLSCTLRGLARARDDRHVIGRHMLRKLARELARCLEARRRLPAERFFDLDYGLLLRDPVAAAQSICQHFGVPLPPHAIAAMRRHHRGHSKDRHGRHDYTAHDFGLDDDLLREAFADYLAFRPSVAGPLAKG